MFENPIRKSYREDGEARVSSGHNFTDLKIQGNYRWRKIPSVSIDTYNMGAPEEFKAAKFEFLKSTMPCYIVQMDATGNYGTLDSMKNLKSGSLLNNGVDYIMQSSSVVAFDAMIYGGYAALFCENDFQNYLLPPGSFYVLLNDESPCVLYALELVE